MRRKYRKLPRKGASAVAEAMDGQEKRKIDIEVWKCRYIVTMLMKSIS